MPMTSRGSQFGNDEAKLEVTQPHLARQAATGRSGVAAIGVAQEFQRSGPPLRAGILPEAAVVVLKADRRVT